MDSIVECLSVFCWCLPCFYPPPDVVEDRTDDRDPLLSQYRDDTTLQRELHQKLHTYQMLRALFQGYMPSNEQIIVNLRTLLASDLLNPDNADLSDSGRALVHYTKSWIKQFIELLQHKNHRDQIENFIWHMAKARVSIDVEDIVSRAVEAKSRAHSAAAYESLKTVASLLLSNSDFRLFLSDMSTIGREVFRDTALTLAELTKQAARRVDPSQEEQQALKRPGADDIGVVRTTEDLQEDVAELAKAVVEGATGLAQEAEHSFVTKITGDEKSTLLYRLKKAVAKLRQRENYSESVSTLAKLLQRHAFVYSHILEDTASTAKRDFDPSPEMDVALKNFWALVRSFGDPNEWQELETRYYKVLQHGKADPEFDRLIRQVGKTVQDVLTDPDFFDHAEQRFQDLRTRSRQLASDTLLREDVDGLLVKFQSTLQSVLQDDDVSRLLKTSTCLAKILSPAHQYINTDLVTDAIDFYVPKIVEAMQYLPIPRLEISTPKVDLLLENLILEPGKTVNNSSFFPHRLRVETRNHLEIRKAYVRTTSTFESSITLKIQGVSIRAEEVGYWLRVHAGLVQLSDEGIASFSLDEKGIDFELDIDVGKDKLEKILSLQAVRVHIHKLDYTVRKSNFAFAATLFKPVVLPIVRTAIETQMATGISDFIHAANRELLYARERLRATRIADPDDLWTFIKAISARLAPEQDPDLYTRIGITEPGIGVFKGIYAPGSIIKVWNEEAVQSKQRIRENELDGWRNEIFDVLTSNI